MELKTRYLCLILLASFTQSLQAAELAGRIWFPANKKSASNIDVTVQCPDGKRHSATTDNYGFYRVKDIPAKQKDCYIYISKGSLHAAPLLFYSGQGRDTRNFRVVPKDNKLIVRQY